MNLQSGLVALYILAKIANLMIIYPIKEKREKKLLKISNNYGLGHKYINAWS